MKRVSFFIMCFLLLSSFLSAQELNCRVQVNSDKIQGTNKQVFTTLEQAISEYINNRKWSNAQISNNERIECTFLLTVNEVEDNRYKCDLQVQSRRPVYNASYSTAMLNFRDTEFEFNYQEYEPLVYNENTLESNLTAVIDFYVYMILGLDFDSFSPEGGTVFFQQAEKIVAMGQSSMEIGWKAFESNRNRHALMSAFIEPRTALFRQLWYTYHRKGLDEMTVSADKGRAKITEAINQLKEVRSESSTSVVLPIFSDSKLDEVINIYSKAPQQEKEDIYKILIGIYPTENSRLKAIREESR